MKRPSHGIFNVDKPPGITSMDVVRQIKRFSSQRHVGHAGTLDPAATGVLPVCLGQATRLMQFIVNTRKEYLATVHLGVSTDTYDSVGEIIHRQDVSDVTAGMIEVALAPLRGVVEQTPPAFSALKKQGRRLYALARDGVAVQAPPRTVEVLKLELIEWQPPQARLSVQCSRGFYVRSLAHDLGQALGCGAHLSQLRRLRTGPFCADDATPLESLSTSLGNNTWEPLFLPSDCVVLHLPAVQMDSWEASQVMNGQAVPLSPGTHYASHLQEARGYSRDGLFVALMRFDRASAVWRPFKVFDMDRPSPYSNHNPLV